METLINTSLLWALNQELPVHVQCLTKTLGKIQGCQEDERESISGSKRDIGEFIERLRLIRGEEGQEITIENL